MGVHHIVTNIEGLLKQKDRLLGNLFNISGEDARKALEKLKSKGHKFVGSENCRHFDPIKGCCCEEFENNEKPIIRAETKKIN